MARKVLAGITLQGLSDAHGQPDVARAQIRLRRTAIRRSGAPNGGPRSLSLKRNRIEKVQPRVGTDAGEVRPSRPSSRQYKWLPRPARRSETLSWSAPSNTILRKHGMKARVAEIKAENAAKCEMSKEEYCAHLPAHIPHPALHDRNAPPFAARYCTASRCSSWLLSRGSCFGPIATLLPESHGWWSLACSRCLACSPICSWAR